METLKSNSNQKYFRTYHSPISLGATSDDKFMPSGYLNHFMNKEIVLTEKLDGQNNCFNQNGLFARSHSKISNHAWDKPLINRWNMIKEDLKSLGVELFGENMVAIHSIEYKKLESYFYLFAARDQKTKLWLSWEEVRYYAELFDFPIVPEIKISKKLNEINDVSFEDEASLLELFLKNNLSIDWKEYVKTSGLLGGYDVITKEPCCEGFIVRNANSFSTKDSNQNLFKIVRENHIQTDKNWSKTWKPHDLIDYNKFYWTKIYQ